jgi:GT2 family glycosyltransferase
MFVSFFLLLSVCCFSTALIDFDADVTFLVKTHERPHSLRKLLDSLRRFYPHTKVLVADDGRIALRQRPSDIAQTTTHIVTLPYDVGLSAARNAMLERVDTKYFITLDDDFVL